jgi:hypothetical protein
MADELSDMLLRKYMELLGGPNATMDAVPSQKALLGGADAKMTGPMAPREPTPRPFRPMGGFGATMAAAHPPKMWGLTPEFGAPISHGLGGQDAVMSSVGDPGEVEEFPKLDADVLPESGPLPSGELPYQTFQRLFGQQWEGGDSEQIRQLLRQFGISDTPGKASTNLALQQALVNRYRD